MLDKLQTQLKKQFGISFNDPNLLVEAFTQGNYLNEHPKFNGRDYQRLEFLGDAVMQLQTAQYLYKNYPSWDEGQLTELRIAMVQTRSFALLAKELAFNDYILLGRGEELNGARHRDSLLEDVWEAFIGALYLDQGANTVTEFLTQHMFAKINTGFYDQFIDFKSKLQELLQKNGAVQIKYQKLSQTDLDEHNQQQFTVAVEVQGKVLATGHGSSLKNAEKAAARAAYQQLMQK
ncbi:ribonuclease III [Periweissella ghanensis]|uniref:Ribonuclease 3 n=1 Tax=Periweissella ghanensis TaxID=467997 RepID=A0ABN8BKB8_9LACO|nr:ribonuclease III [Periweissella ghanensis]MCM0601371.1 ribonuclease III [Periweissella ghanensis]CAH0418157.1 Ribonuclease 3 [Periweissella ghanensis]